MKKLHLLLFIFLCNFAFSQKVMQGQVIDFDTSVPIAFAKISYNNKTIESDWEGKFSIEIANDKKPIVVSYKGFYDKNYFISEGAKYLIIKLVSDNTLKEQELFSENLVNTLIKKVIEEKPRNRPEKVLNTYQYKNYEHLLVSANPDSVSSKIDTISKRNFFGKKYIKIDSTNYKFKKFVEKQHIYQTEKVNLIQYNNKGSKETVLASRMAGFKKPIYEYLGLNLVSYSLYTNTLDILEVAVHNPISNYGRKLYVFKIVDTVKVDGRNAYRVYFQPKKLKSNRLRGLLYIDAENYAVCKAFFRIYGIANINALYTFDYLKNNSIWFPKKRQIMVVKGNNADDLNILGGTIKFSSGFDGIQKNASDQTYIKLESTPFDIEINKKTTFKNPSIKIDVPENSISKPHSFWRTFEKDSLDIRKIPTYSSLDSISESEKIEHKLFLGRKIFNGYFPIGFVDLDLRSIVKYNNYEGFRFGLGGVTNTKLSEKYKIGGFVAYGLKDQKLKYGITPSYLLDKETNTWISASYTDDLKEIGQIQFATDTKQFKIYDPRPINISTFYNHKTFSAYIESKFFPKTDTYFSISRSAVQPLFDYVYSLNGTDYNEFDITSAQFSIQWNPFSEYMQTGSGRLEIDKKYPKISFQYTKSIPNLLSNSFDFSKVDFRIIHEIPYLSGQNTSFIFQGGFEFGDVPLTNLYSVAPNNLNRDNLLKRITFAGKNSFETMYFNEFFSSKYMTFQIRHSFNKVRIAYKIKPQFSVVTRMAWGNMDYQERHIGFQYKTLDKGYIESGVEANSIYKGIGLTLFYRYGPNGLPKFEDNLALKISYVLDLGF